MHNAHFAKLFYQSHETDKGVHCIEENLETPADKYTSERKVKRLALKDELLKMIKGYSS
ncbi:MAG: hypothetical protein ACJAVK_003059 [Akkermansiaceae bacterium]|jgi:uncharacterized protein YdcH (DUF465 family)